VKTLLENFASFLLPFLWELSEIISDRAPIKPARQGLKLFQQQQLTGCSGMEALDLNQC
jgi:hypothetical protein